MSLGKSLEAARLANPVNKQAAIITSQSGCVDTVEMSTETKILKARKELFALEQSLLEAKKSGNRSTVKSIIRDMTDKRLLLSELKQLLPKDCHINHFFIKAAAELLSEATVKKLLARANGLRIEELKRRAERDKND